MNGVNVHRFRSYVNVGHYGLFPGFVPSLKNGGGSTSFTPMVIGSHRAKSALASVCRLNVPTILHVHGGFYTRSRDKANSLFALR